MFSDLPPFLKRARRAFLDLFLELLRTAAQKQNVQTEDICKELMASNYPNVLVQREVLTSTIAKSKRRIDILLTFSSQKRNESFSVGIENKPWAEDQPDQIRDYITFLEANSPEGDFLILYFSPNGHPPSEYSIPRATWKQATDEGRGLAIGYTALMEWVKDCHLACLAEKYRFFLRDLIQFLKINVEEEGS